MYSPHKAPLPPSKPNAHDVATRILTIAVDLYVNQNTGGASIKDCVHIAIEAVWITIKYEIEIQKGTR